MQITKSAAITLLNALAKAGADSYGVKVDAPIKRVQAKIDRIKVEQEALLEPIASFPKGDPALGIADDVLGAYENDTPVIVVEGDLKADAPAKGAKGKGGKGKAEAEAPKEEPAKPAGKGKGGMKAAKEEPAKAEAKPARKSMREGGSAKGEGVDEFGNRKGTAMAKVNSLLSKKPKTMAELVEEAGLKDTCYNHLNKLIGKGLVVKMEKGYVKK
jgi:hypothetical protein